MIKRTIYLLLFFASLLIAQVIATYAQQGCNCTQQNLLKDLVLDNSSFVVSSATGNSIGNVLNTTPGSTLTLTDNHGNAVSLGSGLPPDCSSCVATYQNQILTGSTISNNSGQFTITLTETNSNFSNSPHNSTITLNVSPVEVPLQPISVAASLPSYKYGTNLTGMENCGFNANCAREGPAAINGTDYFDPGWYVQSVFKNYGFSIVRLNLDEWRIQSALSSNFNQTDGYLQLIRNDVEDARSLGLWIILDIHTYDNMYSPAAGSYQKIGSQYVSNANFADFWNRLSTMFKNYPNVIFGLMNEPNGVSAQQWHDTAIAAINAIRNNSTTQIISIPGTAFTTAATWITSGNAAAWAGYADPVGGPWWFEMHQYLDSNYSGQSSVCVTGYGSSVLANGGNGATAWLVNNNYKAFIGEFSWWNTGDSRNLDCNGTLGNYCSSGSYDCSVEGPNLLATMNSSTSPYVGWTWWASGGGFGDTGNNLWINANGFNGAQIQTQNLCTWLRSIGISTNGC